MLNRLIIYNAIFHCITFASYFIKNDKDMFKQPTTQQAVISIQMTPEQFERIEKMLDLITEYTKPKEEKLLTIKQVAELLGVTEPTLWRWNKEGILKRVKVGNKVRYKESDVNKVLEEMA